MLLRTPDIIKLCRVIWFLAIELPLFFLLLFIFLGPIYIFLEALVRLLMLKQFHGAATLQKIVTKIVKSQIQYQ